MRAAALALALLLPAGAATAAEGTLGVRVADEDAQYVVAVVEPGEVLRRRIEVLNGTAEALDVELYAGAATDGPSGFDFAEGRAGNELTGWTTVSPGAVEVPAGRSTAVEVVVRVPEEAAEGERAAVVWAQAADASGGLSLVSRVGVRMHVDVAEGSGVGLPATVAAGVLVLAAAAWVRGRRVRR